MTTEKQRAANRANARKSTGPRTKAGKERSRRNAVKHGLLAEQVLLEHEDPAEWEALREAMFVRFNPADDVEGGVVERVASLVWRMRRIPVFEAAMMRSLADEAKEIDRIGGPDHEPGDPATAARVLGLMVQRLLHQDLTSKLTRYETGLQNLLKAALDELRMLQSERMAREALEATLADVEDAVEVEHVIVVDANGVAVVLEKEAAATA